MESIWFKPLLNPNGTETHHRIFMKDVNKHIHMYYIANYNLIKLCNLIGIKFDISLIDNNYVFEKKFC